MKDGSGEAIQVEEGVWVVILGELCVFTLFFATYLYYRAFEPEAFAKSQALLRADLGVLNTLLLLTSSWTLAEAVSAIGNTARHRKVIPLLTLTLACGTGFIAIKVIEYSAAISAGINVLTDGFFMFYFMLTGIHLAHLLVGMALLLALTLHTRNTFKSGTQVSEPLLGFASCFWHMVDILWLVLFPLLYLLG